MNETVQHIIVAIILLAAIAWCIKRLFAKKNDCHCDDHACSGCPLGEKCTLKNKKEKSDDTI